MANIENKLDVGVLCSQETLRWLTQRALSDLAAIRDYSTKEWGRKTAEKYLEDLESGLQNM